MNINEVKLFLEKFEINKDIIQEYLKDNKIIEVNKNYFLRKNKFNSNQIFGDSLIYIQLKKKLVSKFLLNFIKLNSNNIIEIISEKQAINFTYNKNLQIESIKNSKDKKFNSNKNYVVIYNAQVLGYSLFQKENKKLFFKNEMNIGEYLKEN